MDEPNVPDDCIVLSPEELAALGVNLDTSATAADKTEHASVDAPITEQRKHPPKQHHNSKINSKETHLLERESRGPNLDRRIREPSSTTCDSPLTRTSESEAIKNSEADNVNTSSPTNININHDSTITEASEEEADQASEKSVAIKNSEAEISSTFNHSTIEDDAADDVSVAVNNSESTENHVSPNNVDASNAGCNAIPVKKRGRPKKIVSDEAAALPTLPKRKRGRPKKEVIESDSESEASTSQIRKKRRVNNISSDESDLSDSGPLIKPTVRRIFSSDSESDSETKSNPPATNNTPLVTPKKRGRPKKTPHDSDNLDAATNDTPLITPRKRGRPKKGEEPTKEPFSAPVLPILMGTSKNGRKRKEIDYSFIEQPDLLDKSKSLNKVCDDKELNTVRDSQNDVKQVENSKYKWTGHTTTALNQLFSALQGKPSSEVSNEVEPGIKKRRGRCKVKEEILDEDGSSTCMVCNKTISNREWIRHKQKVHYNLTWRQGQTPIDISDVTVIQKAFAQLRNDVGYLKCNKCKEKMGSAKRFYDHLEVCNGVVNDKGTVSCAVCKKEMAKSEWQYHKYRDHNNLAWREGDPALNLQDQDLVIRILTQLYRAKKPLHCETCKQQKKSVLGYLSHKSVCQMSAVEVENVKVACKLCGKKVLPVSMDFHLKTHNKPVLDSYEMMDEPGFFDVNMDRSLGPRKAAKQALQVIKSIKEEFPSNSKYYVEQCDFDEAFVIDQLKKRAAENANLLCIFNGCEFNTASVDDMVQHLNICDNKPVLYFVCKLCLTWSKEEVDIKDHVKAIHGKVSDKDPEFNEAAEECVSEEDQRIEIEELGVKAFRSKAKQMLYNNAGHKIKPLFLVHPIREMHASLVYPQAYPWMYDFCRSHYTNLNLFGNLRNKGPWQVLDCDILNDYLPRRHVSCDITVKHVKVNEKPCYNGDADFKKLGLFEASHFYKGESTIYCGGSITALAWLPTPYNHENQSQILAVAALNDADKEYVLGKTYNEQYVVQFWSFGELNWPAKQDLSPSLLFGLALNVGPVWHLEWCPSGCLDISDDDERSRLGLLAVATSDSFVYIYCIDNVKEEDDRGLIYKGEPLVKLQLQIQRNLIIQSYATKISWTKAEGHRYVAVGYSSGLVALFDLLSPSALLRRNDRDGTQTIMPYLTFQAHASYITALTLGHYTGGNRWCFTAGSDKVLIFWDLAKMTKVTSNRKYSVSDGLLLTLWPACLLAEDESTFVDALKAHCFIKSVRDVMSVENTTFSYSPSGMKSVSFGDWLNFLLHGGNSGELAGQFVHRVFFSLDRKQFKNSYVRCVFSVAKLVAKERSKNVTRLSTYEETATNCGVAFIDYKADHLKNMPNSKTNDVKKARLEAYNIKDYPLQAVTKVAVNPNAQACAYFAAGYQAGFVRVRGIDFLKDEYAPCTFEDYDFSTSL